MPADAPALQSLQRAPTPPLLLLPPAGNLDIMYVCFTSLTNIAAAKGRGMAKQVKNGSAEPPVTPPARRDTTWNEVAAVTAYGEQSSRAKSYVLRLVELFVEGLNYLLYRRVPSVGCSSE